VNFDLFDLAGFVGVLLIGDRLSAAPTGQTSQFVLELFVAQRRGFMLIMFSLVFKFNVSAVRD
jgi:hypothetical protein